MIHAGAAAGLDETDWNWWSYTCEREGKIHVNGVAQAYARCMPNPHGWAMKGIFGELPSSRIFHAPTLRGGSQQRRRSEEGEECDRTRR